MVKKTMAPNSRYVVKFSESFQQLASLHPNHRHESLRTNKFGFGFLSPLAKPLASRIPALGETAAKKQKGGEYHENEQSSRFAATSSKYLKERGVRKSSAMIYSSQKIKLEVGK